MAYKKRTLRTMSPTARKVARLIGELESVARRLKNTVPELQRLDLNSKALENAKQFDSPPFTKALVNGARLGVVKEILAFVLCYDAEIPKSEMVEYLRRKERELES